VSCAGRSNRDGRVPRAVFASPCPAGLSDGARHTATEAACAIAAWMQVACAPRARGASRHSLSLSIDVDIDDEQYARNASPESTTESDHGGAYLGEMIKQQHAAAPVRGVPESGPSQRGVRPCLRPRRGIRRAIIVASWSRRCHDGRVIRAARRRFLAAWPTRLLPHSRSVGLPHNA
jgi:hypothetical protein